MSRKNRKKKPRRRPQRPQRLSRQPAFAVGDAVRVRLNVVFDDNEDIPMGGWSGTIEDINSEVAEVVYAIKWDDRTLTGMPPIDRFRCERDGFYFEIVWLAEEDLEPNVGEPVPLQRPTALVPRPLRRSESDDRVREIFHLTSDDPLPLISDASFERYHQYLTEALRFPFEALPPVLSPHTPRWTVRRLVPLEECDLDMGLLCEVTDEDGETGVIPLEEAVPSPSSKNYHLIADYAEWLSNNETELSLRSDEEAGHPPGQRSTWALLGVGMVLGGGYGCLLGCLLAGYSGAETGAMIGSTLLGLVGLLFALIVGSAPGNTDGKAGAAVFFLIVGGLLGALPGALLFAWQPALVGVGSSLLLSPLIPRRYRGVVIILGIAALAGLLGAVGWACYIDLGNAFLGALYGGLIGALGALAVLGISRLAGYLDELQRRQQ